MTIEASKIVDINKLTNKKKAAAVVIAMGVDRASEVYKFLRDDEIEQLTMEISSMSELSPEVMEGTLQDFHDLCLAQKFVTEGGMGYAKAVLKKAIGQSKADQLLEKVAQSMKTRAFDFLKNVDPSHLLSFIQNEHPQTIALVLSYTSTAEASQVLSSLPREIQVNVAERIANMDRTSPETVKEVEKVLETKIAAIGTVDYAEIGGTKYVAEILNSVDRGTEKYILEEMSASQPELTEEIRKRMFVFEDIATLDNQSIQRFLQDVDSKDLLIALKGSSKEVQDVFYSNMSSRMSETMKEDAKYLGGVRLSDVEQAQQKLVALIRNLEEAGEVYISRGGKDEIIV